MMLMLIDESVRTLADGADSIKWRSFKGHGADDNTYEWYYAENDLYLIRHHRLKSYHIVRAKSPEVAYQKLKRTFYGKDVNK